MGFNGLATVAALCEKRDELLELILKSSGALHQTVMRMDILDPLAGNEAPESLWVEIEALREHLTALRREYKQHRQEHGC